MVDGFGSENRDKSQEELRRCQVSRPPHPGRQHREDWFCVARGICSSQNHPDRKAMVDQNCMLKSSTRPLPCVLRAGSAEPRLHAEQGCRRQVQVREAALSRERDGCVLCYEPRGARSIIGTWRRRNVCALASMPGGMDDSSRNEGQEENILLNQNSRPGAESAMSMLILLVSTPRRFIRTTSASDKKSVFILFLFCVRGLTKCSSRWSA